MTYPEPSYFGEKGEISATFRPAGHEPELTYQSGNTVDYLATGASTGGKFGLYRWNMGPEPSGPGPHFHRSISESFFILTGTVKIFNGDRWIDTHPGDFVHVPEGGIHGFRNESGEPASMLLHFSPGAPREGYFEGLAEFAVSGRPGEEELAEFYLRHDNHWL
ncbi:cupin domain-containing protein [Planomonospora venezuelensis]|uniref:Mannose-6-phosphate isomerase-like protein (Cupin superfamily) n=1 Tax=Planomonospora venezuelensis TaxID=1999 RepID=A0A841DAH0_PLAVE|nr:cupin domain-containing protein [Planomonospora venezuelensis]MBB5965125.1 mannose-6-phosphate isomerase-like protein (cupin superfamily) [Planomonospora venezuelensis]GIN00402.1 cupin [Planomonospora venezuelensis]